jgi:hypothetical protein
MVVWSRCARKQCAAVFLVLVYGSAHGGVRLSSSVRLSGSVRQCAAVCGSVRQCAAVCGSVRQCAAMCCNVLQCVAVWGNAAVRVAVCGSAHCSVQMCNVACASHCERQCVNVCEFIWINMNWYDFVLMRMHLNYYRCMKPNYLLNEFVCICVELVVIKHSSEFLSKYF